MGNGNTAAVIGRFWDRMRETYGARWVETYGATPPQAWRETIDRFSPSEISQALSDLQSIPHLRQHPPTLPQFEQLLAQAQRRGRAEMTAADWRRGYWRSCVIGGVITATGYAVGTEELGRLMARNAATLGRAMRDLLDELDNAEASVGQRTEGMQRRCVDGSIAIARSYRHLWASPGGAQSDTGRETVGDVKQDDPGEGAPF